MYLTKKSRKCTKNIRKGEKCCWIHKGQARLTRLTRQFSPARPIKEALEGLRVPETQVAYNPVHVNRCMECGVDMGDENPRQLCRKWFCENKY